MTIGNRVGVGPQTPDLTTPTSERGPVGVVIVHRNSSDACVATIERFGDQGVPVDIVVVDNDSDSHHRARLRDACPEVTLIETRANVGFGPGLNIGLRRWLRRGVGDWVVAAPHDALVEPGGLARMIALAEAEPRAGIVCGDVGDQATPHVDPYLGAIPAPATVRAGWDPAHYPHGTLIVARRACLEQIGVFDERYFAYNDEADLGLRARQAGWQVGLARDVMVENPMTSTMPSVIEYLRLRNTILLLKTHFGWPQAALRVVVALGNVAHATVRPKVRAPWYVGKERLRGVVAALRRQWGGPPADLPN